MFNPAPASILNQVLDCPCLDCKHEFFEECIHCYCPCCALEDGYFVLTGDELRDT